jgi:anti-anti-sigma factor
MGVEMDERPDNAGAAATCEALVDAAGTPTLKLFGELDLGSLGPIRRAFDAIVKDQPARVIVDVSELRFIDSSGLSLFLSVAHQIDEVELRDPSPTLRKVIGLTGLTDVFVMTP